MLYCTTQWLKLKQARQKHKHDNDNRKLLALIGEHYSQRRHVLHLSIFTSANLTVYGI